MATKRQGLSKKTRFEVFKRDGFKCMYCGAHPPVVILEVDHIVAVAAGGKNNSDNLITSCQPCNRGKGATDLKTVPKALGEKADEIAEREAQLAGYAAVMDAARQRLDRDTWRVLQHLLNGGEHMESAPQDQYSSVRRFIEKLGLYAVLEAADIALASPVSHSRLWRYFCGICWNKVREAEQ